MSRLRWLRPSPGALIAVVALLLAMSGAAVAGTSLVDTSDLRRGAVTAPKIAKDAVRKAKIADGAVTSAAFAAGAVAPKANSATTAESASKATNVMFAVVNADGTLARSYAGNNMITATRVATGSYQVAFLNIPGRDLAPQPTSVTGCSWSAAVGVSGIGSATPGVATTGLAPAVGSGFENNGTNVVAVNTYDLSGNPADNGFHLQVVC